MTLIWNSYVAYWANTVKLLKVSDSLVVFLDIDLLVGLRSLYARLFIIDSEVDTPNQVKPLESRLGGAEKSRKSEKL